jgi:hypothetical protein
VVHFSGKARKMNHLPPFFASEASNRAYFYDALFFIRKPYKEQLISKLSKKMRLDDAKKNTDNWIAPVLFFILGIVLIIAAGRQRATAPPPTNEAIYTNLTVGLETAFLGMLSFGIGFCILFTRLFKKMKINNPN